MQKKKKKVKKYSFWVQNELNLSTLRCAWKSSRSFNVSEARSNANEPPWKIFIEFVLIKLKW